MIPAAVIVATLAVVLVPFVRRLPRHVARPLVFAGVLFVGAALGIELLEGWLDDHNSIASLGNTVARGSQEILELVGELIGLWALLRALGPIEISTTSDEPTVRVGKENRQ